MALRVRSRQVDFTSRSSRRRSSRSRRRRTTDTLHCSSDTFCFSPPLLGLGLRVEILESSGLVKKQDNSYDSNPKSLVHGTSRGQ